MSEDGDVAGAITALIAVGTLPLGILAAVVAGPTTAVVVFVIGWLLLTPISAIVLDELLPALRSTRSDGEEDTNAVETLRERYARGEIDEVEMERRLDALLETEDVDPDDEAAIERAIERIDAGEDEEVGEADVERE